MNWTRSIVDRQAWEQTAERLRNGAASLLSLWGEAGWAHMAVMERNAQGVRLFDLACNGAFPSVGRHHAPGHRLGRAQPDHDLTEQSPVLLHGAQCTGRR